MMKASSVPITARKAQSSGSGRAYIGDFEFKNSRKVQPSLTSDASTVVSSIKE